MANFAIGDIHGCFHTFNSLLEKISFNNNSDTLWLVGDIVNRGKNSLEVIHWCFKNQQNIKLSLGNHDLHFLALAFSITSKSKKDTLDGILKSPNLSLYKDWLLSVPLLHVNGNYIMTHAGLLPSWSKKEAILLAQTFSDALQSNPEHTLESMYGNYPNQWRDNLSDKHRLRMIVNIMTRMRCINHKEYLNFTYKGDLQDLPPNLQPWFALKTKRQDNEFTITGHWSAIGYFKHILGVSLDSSCVWGGHLTALCLETKKIYMEKADSRDLA
mgnify:FL=1